MVSPITYGFAIFRVRAVLVLAAVPAFVETRFAEAFRLFAGARTEHYLETLIARDT